MNSRTNIHPIDRTDWSLDHIVDAFEEKLDADGSACIEEFIPASHEQQDEIAFELIRVDLAHRHSRGDAVSIEQYRERFSELLSDRERLGQLAMDDYRFRCSKGEPVERADYQRLNVDVDGWPSREEVVSALKRSKSSRNQDDYPITGEKLLDFQLLAEFGRGAFSRVYLAQQPVLADRLVVLKVSRRFWAESDVLARLQHTNIVPIHSVHRHDDMQIVCMPFWGTCTLADILREVKSSPELQSRDWSNHAFIGTVAQHQHETVVSLVKEHVREGKDSATSSNATPTKEQPSHATESDLARKTGYIEACLRFGIQIADGLQHAHQRGIIHGDLKPANILIADDGRPMILDFNLSVDTSSIATKAVGGTLAYMAPEVLESLAQEDNQDNNHAVVQKLENHNATKAIPASDVYSLGVVLYELVTGSKPFPFRPGQTRSFTDVSDSRISRMQADRENVPSPRANNPQIPIGLSRIIERCLAPNPRERYQTAEQVREDLQRQLDDRSLVHVRETVNERTAKLYRRNPKIAWAGLSAVLALVGLLSYWGFVSQRARADRLNAVATYREFMTDADWLTTMHSVTPIEADHADESWRESENWLRRLKNLDRKGHVRHLSEHESAKLDRSVAELLYCMAGSRINHVEHDLANSDRHEMLSAALKFNLAAQA